MYRKISLNIKNITKLRIIIQESLRTTFCISPLFDDTKDDEEENVKDDPANDQSTDPLPDPWHDQLDL